jgi:hypothetical protein
VKRNLKLLYLLTLGALCLYVTTGPAEAGFAVNGPISDAEASLITTQGILNAAVDPYFDPSAGTTVDLDLNVLCVSGPCTATVNFDFYVSAPGLITVELSGTSNDPDAAGEVLFPWSPPPPSLALALVPPALNPQWVVDGIQLSMDTFTVLVPVNGRYYGQFTITSLAEGRWVNLGEKSLEFTYNSAVPEPGSALLLGAGIAFVAFLRRKTQR